MKIELTDKTYRVDCSSCDEFLEIDGVDGQMERPGALIACGTWAGMHICYKRRLNIARETGNIGKEKA